MNVRTVLGGCSTAIVTKNTATIQGGMYASS